MTRKYLLIILCLSFLQKICSAKENLKYTTCTKVIQEKNECFIISTKPVTNREYLVYLFWLGNVFGTDHPEIFIDAIPSFALNKEIKEYLKQQQATNMLDTLFKYSNPIIKNYLFNAKYIDYPVVGVNWQQATNFNKWFQDRYNEFLLIKNGYLEYNTNQKNEDNFQTETYLLNIYEVSTKKNISIEDKYLLLEPIFRLPTQQELDVASKNRNLGTQILPYKNCNHSFLSIFQNSYFTTKGNTIIIKESVLSPQKGVFNAFNLSCDSCSWNVAKYNYKELTLGNNESMNQLSYNEFFTQNGQTIVDIKKYGSGQRNSVGTLPILYYKKGIPQNAIFINAYPNKSSIEDKQSLNFFRVVLRR